jgi:hypothetical protein
MMITKGGTGRRLVLHMNENVLLGETPFGVLFQLFWWPLYYKKACWSVMWLEVD